MLKLPVPKLDLVTENEVRLLNRKGAISMALARVVLLCFLISAGPAAVKSLDVNKQFELAINCFEVILLIAVGGNAVDKVNDTLARIKGKPSKTDQDKPDPTTTPVQ